MRLKQIQHALRDGCTALALTAGEDFRYAVGWSPFKDERLTLLLISQSQVQLVIAAVNAVEAIAHLGNLMSFHLLTDEGDPNQVLHEVMESFNADEWLVSNDARYDHARVIAEIVGQPLGLASNIIAPLRAQKDEHEIALLMESQRINDMAMRAGLEAIQVGITELELAEVIRRAFMSNGADKEAFIIVAFGDHTALPHHSPTSRFLQPGPVLLDIGCYYHGYASDMTRVAYLGTPSATYRQVHSVVEQAIQEAHRAAAPGVSAMTVDRAARQVIAARGFGQYFTHRIGHGIGLSVHEPPSVTETNAEPLLENAAFSIEPGIYLPGEFGVRLEEVVINRPSGAEVLSSISRQIYVKPL